MIGRWFGQTRDSFVSGGCDPILVCKAVSPCRWSDNSSTGIGREAADPWQKGEGWRGLIAGASPRKDRPSCEVSH